jgi:signal transduction histidine kinase
VVDIDRIADALSTTATRVDQALLRERSFSADVSHQLRTPLTALRVIIESSMLEEQPSHKTLERSLHEVDRLEQTITDLIALSRESRDSRKQLDVAWLQTWLTDHWAEQFSDANRFLSVNCEPDLPPVIASEAATRQVLDVLLNNALKHGTGGVDVNIRYRGGGLIVDVCDEGSITADPATLFTRRFNNSPDHRIGLSLAQSLVEAEGGALYLSSAAPTRFSLAYPSTSQPGTSIR